LTELSPATTLIDQASQELPAALAAISVGDDVTTGFAREVRKLVDHVNGESRKAVGRAAQLHDDDVMNPAGKARLLEEIPANLMAATVEQLDQAELNLGIIEDLHVGAILRHNPREDANLREELHNYTATLKQKDAVVAMVALAGNVRYSTFMAGPMGESLAARFAFEPAILRRVALEALGVNGTEDQVRRSAALAAIPAMRRVIGLARGGRDNAVEHVKRPPARKPSTALMS
jgi:hypothetical protein